MSSRKKLLVVIAYGFIGVITGLVIVAKKGSAVDSASESNVSKTSRNDRSSSFLHGEWIAGGADRSQWIERAGSLKRWKGSPTRLQNELTGAFFDQALLLEASPYFDNSTIRELVEEVSQQPSDAALSEIMESDAALRHVAAMGMIDLEAKTRLVSIISFGAQEAHLKELIEQLMLDPSQENGISLLQAAYLSWSAKNPVSAAKDLLSRDPAGKLGSQLRTNLLAKWVHSAPMNAIHELAANLPAGPMRTLMLSSAVTRLPTSMRSHDLEIIFKRHLADGAPDYILKGTNSRSTLVRFFESMGVVDRITGERLANSLEDTTMRETALRALLESP